MINLPAVTTGPTIYEINRTIKGDITHQLQHRLLEQSTTNAMQLFDKAASSARIHQRRMQNKKHGTKWVASAQKVTLMRNGSRQNMLRISNDNPILDPPHRRQDVRFDRRRHRLQPGQEQRTLWGRKPSQSIGKTINTPPTKPTNQLLFGHSHHVTGSRHTIRNQLPHDVYPVQPSLETFAWRSRPHDVYST
uniref:Uncharacterized protein n=1 Tax=Caenorhabditis japonica TaxID=281687 RepID=A0A8R1EQQ9_CAEJA